MSSELGEFEAPKKWRFTWEAQSHIPTLRLFLFDSRTNPAVQCHDLRVDVCTSQSLVLVSWSDGVDVLLRTPIPRVLIDGESPVSFTAFDDHIEVKLVLLLPVGHPIVLSFNSVLNSSDDEGIVDLSSSKPLSVASDTQRLSSSGGVHFYCRNCEFNLARSPVREFVEMPSVNWREVADNWFGACCCSFGGISEKLVSRFANSYTCAKGVCLVDFATITICKDDLVEFSFSNSSRVRSCEAENDLTSDTSFDKSMPNSRSNNGCNEKSKFTTLDDNFEEYTDKESNVDRLSCLGNLSTGDDLSNGCTHHDWGTCQENRKLIETMEVSENRKSFLNGFLGNIFMVRSSNLSEDVEWVEFNCPECSVLIGAYPCASNGSAPLDGGIRLFKCYISTSLPTRGSGDLFRDYTLDRMFTNQLLDIAKDELSYRSVIRDLETKVPMLQVDIVNTNSWSCTGFCWSAQSSPVAVPKIDLQPVIKMLFTECCSNKESELRIIEDQIRKGFVDEIFMLRRQIEDTAESLLSQRNILPPSCSSLQGLSLSSMKR